MLVSYAPPDSAPNRQILASQAAGVASFTAPITHRDGARGTVVPCSIGHDSTGHPRVSFAAGAVRERAARGRGWTAIQHLFSPESAQGLGSGPRASRRSLEVLQPRRGDFG